MTRSESYTCSCCDGLGKVDFYGTCPLCDGLGAAVDTVIESLAGESDYFVVAKAIVSSQNDCTDTVGSDHIFVVERIPDKGFGVVAARFINAGELVCSELPLISVRGTEDFRARIAREMYSDVQSDASSMRALNAEVVQDERMNRLMVEAFLQLDLEARHEFLSLADSFATPFDVCLGSIVMMHDIGHIGVVTRLEVDGCDRVFVINIGDATIHRFEGELNASPQGTLAGIFFTNAVGGSEEVDISHVYGRSSRFNHSCTPNAIVSGSDDGLARKVFASRPISTGEEICISYAEDYRGAAHAEFRAQLCNVAQIVGLPFEDLLIGLFRERLFAKWGFWCECKRCSEASVRADGVLASWHAL